MTSHVEAAPGTIEGVTLAPPGGQVRWPAVFLVLILPYGLSAGYTSLTLAFLLGRNGLGTMAITTILAASLWPQVIKVLWAPLIDTVGSPKLWYGIGAVLVGASLILMSALPPTQREVPLLTVIAVLSSVASTFCSMSTEMFMTRGVPPSLHGRASGWSQAGNMCGSLGGGIGLLLAEHVARAWVSGLVLALICLACWAGVLAIPRIDRARVPRSYVASLGEVWRDVWEVVRSRSGYLVFVLMLLPIGSGVAPWAAIAGEWHADADLVAVVTGALGGLISAAGAIAAGYVCDRIEAKRAYCLFGLLAGMAAASMIWAPHTPAVFASFTLLYGAFIGGGFAAYTAVVLRAIGRKSAATNFNLMAAASNVPLAVMTSFDGWVHDRYGTDAMLAGELALPAVTIAAFALFAMVTRPCAALA